MKRVAFGVVCACGGGGGGGGGAKPVPVAETQPKLSATLNGNRVVFASARAVSLEDGRIVVTVSTHPLTCAQVTAEEEVSPAKDGLVFELTLAPRLRPTGELGWKVDNQEFEHAGINGKDTAIEARIVDAAAGQHSKFNVDESVDNPRSMVSDEKTRTLVVWGEVDAIGCGTHPRHKWVAPKAQPATFAIAGRDYPLSGAAVHDEGRKRVVVLSTDEVTCSEHGASASGRMNLEITLGDGSTSPRGAIFDGDYVGQRGWFQSNGGGLTVLPMQWAADASLVELELGGLTKVIDDHGQGSTKIEVGIRGKVRATVCPPPRGL